MGFKKFLSNVKTRYNDGQKQKRQKNAALQKQQMLARKLLDEFTIQNMNDFLKKYLNDLPPSKYKMDKKTGKNTASAPKRKDYIKFVFDHVDSGDISFDQLKNYAQKSRIISPSFFDSKVPAHDDFTQIINAIDSEFEPEKITREVDLEDQLMIYLKTKFPKRKIERQVSIHGNNILDILIDDVYAFELKIPSSKSDLRNLGAQLEEYKQYYPDICAVIFDDANSSIADEISDYVIKFEQRYEICSIILNGTKR